MKHFLMTLLISLLFVGCGPDETSWVNDLSELRDGENFFVALGKTPSPENDKAFRIFAAPSSAIDQNSVRFCLTPFQKCKEAGALFVDATKVSNTSFDAYVTNSFIALRNNLSVTVFAKDQAGKEIYQTFSVQSILATPATETPIETPAVQDELVPNPDNFELSETEFGVIKLVNQERKKRGLKILIVQPSIMKSSRNQSEIMKRRGRMQHGFTSGWRRENIAMGQRSPASVMNAWMNSSGHKRNILSNVKYIGVGDTAGQGGSIYWTQQFN